MVQHDISLKCPGPRGNREYFILEKDGIPVAGIMNVDELEDYLDLQNPGLEKQIRKSHEEYRRGQARMPVCSSPDCGARLPNPRSKSREWLASFELSPRRRLNESFEKSQKGTQRSWTQWKKYWRSFEKILTIAAGSGTSASRAR